jgi:hypothetical protein
LPAEQIQAGGETLMSVFHKLINCIWYKEELPISGRILLFSQFTGRAIKV